MQFPLFAVLAYTVIIVQAIGQIGVFLNFSNQRTGSDGMDCPRLNKKQIILLDWNPLQVFHQGAIGDCIPHLLFGVLPFKTVHEFCVLTGIQHIPHLSFAQLTVFVLLRVSIRGMHLHRQIFLGIDKLDKNRQCIFALVARSQILRVRSQHLCQFLFIKRAAYHIAGAIGVRGALPCLCQRGQVDVLLKFIIQATAAPKIILAGRSE